jgi:hypothetical protein
MEDEMGKPMVASYSLRDSRGRHIRLASMVTLEDGTEVRFVERMPNGEAIRQARAERDRQTLRDALGVWNTIGVLAGRVAVTL